MKKIFSFILVLVLVSAINVGSAGELRGVPLWRDINLLGRPFLGTASVLRLTSLPLGLASSERDEGAVAGVIGTAGTNATFELSPGKIFTSDANMGQNLYENIYNRVRYQGSDLAIKRVLANKDVSKEELLEMAPGANISKLMSRPDPSQSLGADQIEARRLEVQGMLAEAKDLADMEVFAQLMVEPTELFANGDESDSGFDLIADLEIIDTILFGKMEMQMGNSGPGAPANNNEVSIGGGITSQAAEANRRDESARAAGANGGAGQGAGAAGAQNPANQMVAGDGSEEKGIICPVNSAFNSAVSKAREDQKKAGAGGAGGAGGGQGGAGGGGNAGQGGGTGAGEGTDVKKDAKGNVIPEQPGNFARQRPCDDIICIKYEAVYKKESSYIANANCIACHFEKINDAFKKTLDHNLVPSKATGNFMEGPKCKRSLFNLKQNFILIPNPIMTPPNDDIIVKGDFIKNLEKFYEKYFDRPEKTATEQVLDRASGNQTKEITDVMQEIEQEVGAQKEEALKLLKTTSLVNDAQAVSSQYRVLMQEIDTMNSYFESYRTMFEGMVKSDIAPCKILEGLPQCS